MDTVTYPHDTVAAFLADHFVGLKIDMLAKHPDFKEASLGQRVIWAPTLIFSDAKGREIRRYVGWLAPEAFVAELRLVLSTLAFNGGDFAGARDGFGAVVDANQPENVAEALYWHGIAGFLAGNRDMDALRASWERCAKDYAGTRWAMHASVIEDAK